MRLIPVYTWTKSFRNFKVRRDALHHRPWFQGVLLMLFVLIAMILANVPAFSSFYHAFLSTELTIHLESPDSFVNVFFPRGMTMQKFINDILMVLFFFTVGLEIKREVRTGELSSFKKAILPVIAAFGGVLVPALIYTLVNHGTLSASGWGIPTATDIAFAICILSVLGKKVPLSLKVFLTALAVADDLIAILVVAFFYGGHINLPLLAVALLVVALTFFFRRINIQSIQVYIIATIVVWILFYYAGIHATMAGVVMSFIIPVKPRYNRAYFYHKMNKYWKRIERYDEIQDEEAFPNGPQKHCLRRMEQVSNNSMDMSYRIEHALSNWVNFFILPLFALANAGVTIPDLSYLNVFQYDSVLGGVGMGVFFGLVLGKPLGITLFSFAAVKTRIAKMPEGADWAMLFAVACMGGIGFTMSLFVDSLSFRGIDPDITQHLRDAGKIAVLLGSVCSALLGSVIVNALSRRSLKK